MGGGASAQLGTVPDLERTTWFAWSHRGLERATVALKARFERGARGLARAPASPFAPRELLPHAARGAVILVGGVPDARLRVERAGTVLFEGVVELARVRPSEQAWPRALPDAHDFRSAHVVPPEQLLPLFVPGDVITCDARGGRRHRVELPALRCELHAEVAGAARPARVTAACDLVTLDLDSGAFELVHRGLVPLAPGTAPSTVRAVGGSLVELAPRADGPQSTLPAQASEPRAGGIAAARGPLPFVPAGPVAIVSAEPPPSVPVPRSASPASTLPIASPRIEPGPRALGALPFRGAPVVVAAAPPRRPSPPADAAAGEDRRLAELRARLEAGADCAKLDLRNLDLSQLRLAGAALDGADLSGAVLAGVSLLRASLVGARLVGADLRGADLSRATLDGAVLDEARLQKASLNQVRAHRTSFRACDASDCTLWHADLAESQWEGARLDRAMLLRAKLPRARLERASLQGAYLRKCDLRHAELDAARLDGADLRGSDLSDARFGSANLEAALQEISLQFHS